MVQSPTLGEKGQKLWSPAGKDRGMGEGVHSGDQEDPFRVSEPLGFSKRLPAEGNSERSGNPEKDHGIASYVLFQPLW